MENPWPRERLRPLPPPFGAMRAHDHLATSRGAVWLYALRATVLYTQASGHWELPVAQRFIEFAQRQFRPGAKSVHVHDWYDVSGYDSEVRSSLTKWVVADRQYFAGVHMLVSSPIVAMGVATANVATSAAGVHMQSYRDRATFERIVAEIVQKQR